MLRWKSKAATKALASLRKKGRWPSGAAWCSSRSIYMFCFPRCREAATYPPERHSAASDLGEDLVEVGCFYASQRSPPGGCSKVGRRTPQRHARWREAGSTVQGKVAEEGGDFSTEALVNLDPDTDETGPSLAQRFGGHAPRLGCPRPRR